MNQPISVADILPFWRYAVCPSTGHSPGIPFYRLSSAEAFFEDAKLHLPFSGVKIFKRKHGKLELVKEYKPGPEWRAIQP